ncbi:AMP-dependent synthetase [Vandammella animalimorsus]|uniref:AMP-dependent synthetase n=1 Tax=Vandammella animalimorsus TaxID=2029117 RepID=A0A2A2ATZ8_9BURK|nr:AMP-binding protein [Vandammella animalimorsus]PAT41162.1 AMP-dependent synthetase [Vandammella animalimorsus]
MLSDQALHESLRHHARQRPNASALIWYGRAITWRELDDWSDALGAHLQSLGVSQGEPVALFMNNCPQYLVAHYAIQKIGAVVCPCSPLNKAHELQYQLSDLDARVIIAADTLLPVVSQVQEHTALRHVLAVRYGELLPAGPTISLPPELQAAPLPLPPGVDDALALAQQGAAHGRKPTPVTINMDDTALMTYTSGTTGMPKGAMLSYGNALFKTQATIQSSGVQADDVLLSVAPLYHIAGMLMAVNAAVLAGATQVLLHRFDPLAVLQAIDRYRVNWWYSIAPMNVACMQVPNAASFNLKSLRRNLVTSFGITLTESLAQQWQAFTGGGCVSCEAAYGLSETHTLDTTMPADAIRWGTHGKPVPGVEIRIVDPDTGAQLPTGELGEIILRSPGNFKGYWRKPEATATTLRDGWVWTGDQGRMDADGYLTFVGRTKEMIKVSGYSVFPEEVESILIKHPAVAQAAVLAEPDEEKGETVKAFVVLKPGASLSAQDLVSWSRENMATYKVPRHVQFIDALPTTGAGKVLRRLLKSAN